MVYVRVAEVGDVGHLDFDMGSPASIVVPYAKCGMRRGNGR